MGGCWWAWIFSKSTKNVVFIVTELTFNTELAHHHSSAVYIEVESSFVKMD